MTLVTHQGDLDSVDIATVRPDGTGLLLLTHETAGTSAAFQPDYSPSGREIVFTENGPNGCRLIGTDVRGHHRRQLHTADGCYVNSSWGTGQPSAGRTWE